MRSAQRPSPRPADTRNRDRAKQAEYCAFG